LIIGVDGARTALEVEGCVVVAGLERGRHRSGHQLVAGAVAAPLGTLHPNIAPYGELFACADGRRIILAVGSDAQFAGLCRVLRQEHLVEDARFGKNVDRVRHRQYLAAALAEAIATWPRATLLEALLQAEVPAGALNDIEAAMASPAARAMIKEQTIDGVPTQRVRGNAFRIEPY